MTAIASVMSATTINAMRPKTRPRPQFKSLTSCRISVSGVPVRETQPPSDKKVVPQADPPSAEDVNHLYQIIFQSTKVVVLTGAEISTGCGIPDYGLT
ncbi:hypothetical protein GOBAR_AA33789 [Gossypium barbadense]|uniref:Uncharacterized protein n=1 Tax=Gossypium barbadense TaxID=3634 RepID=A0A2P5W741_GOSBA|nr:hypothetical protein GOBAR_AA33789 [Gossypium barbadense]